MPTSGTNTHSRRELLKYGGISASSIFLAGCAGGSDDTTDNEAGDDLVTYIGGGGISTLDPASHQFVQTSVVCVNLYDPLVFVDPETQEPSPHLATDWSVSENGTVWEFELRDDVTFHNGDSLTAEDVAYSMDRLLSIGQGYSFLFSDTLSEGDTTALDDTTVQFELSQPFSILPATLTRLMVVNKNQVEPEEVDGDYGADYLQTNVAGSGPYSLVEWDQSNEDILFEPYDDHWLGWPDNRLERVQWSFVPEVSTVQTMFDQGDAHAVHTFFPDTTKREIAEFDNVRMEQETEKSTNAYYIFQHTQKPPLDDVHVRRAIAYAFDYESVIEDILGGTEMAGPVPSALAAHNSDLTPIRQDLDRAQQELEEASYSLDEINDIRMEDSYDPDLPTNREAALVFQNSVEQIGIESVEIVGDPFPALADRVQDQESSPHFYHQFAPSNIPSAHAFLNSMYMPSAFGTTNGGHWYSTDELQEVLTDAVSAPDLETQTDHWHEAQQMIQDSHAALNIAQLPVLFPMSEDLEGWTFRGALGFDVYFNDWSSR